MDKHRHFFLCGTTKEETLQEGMKLKDCNTTCVAAWESHVVQIVPWWLFPIMLHIRVLGAKML